MLSLRRLPFLLFLLVALPALAQTTGSINGRVSSNGASLPGVTVEATSPDRWTLKNVTLNAGIRWDR
jgi:hypothetical protein